MNKIYSEIEELFKSDGVEDFSVLPDDKETKRKFVKLYNEFNNYLSAAIIQGYIPKDDDTFRNVYNYLRNNYIDKIHSLEFNDGNMQEEVYRQFYAKFGFLTKLFTAYFQSNNTAANSTLPYSPICGANVHEPLIFLY